MEMSSMSPKAPRFTAEEESALVSQVLEIIGGITREAVQSLEEPVEADVWSMEEGDDSVFYSDEDQTHQDTKTNASCDFGANLDKHLDKSEGTEQPIPQREGDHVQSSDKEDLEMEKEATLQLVQNDQEEECKEIQSDHKHHLESTDPGTENNLTPENLKSTNTDMQTEPGQSTSTETVNLQINEEEVLLEAQTANFKPSDVTNEGSCTRLNGEAEIPKETRSSELQISGDQQPEVDQESEKDRDDVHVPVGFHQGPSPGHSTLPLPKKSSNNSSKQESFDHLTTSKYSTVSYRKIRKGNTRKKIEEFEYMIMKL